MGKDAQQGCPEREPVDDPEEDMCADDAVDEALQELLRNDSVLLDQLREVVESRGDSKGEEAEAQEGAGITDEGENPHDAG